MLIKLIVVVSISTLTGCDVNNKQSDKSPPKNIVVLVEYKSQPTKEAETLSELFKLIEEVKKEPHFVNIKIHVDPKDKSNILLYEEWDNESYFTTDHMKTPHLKKFVADSKYFLNGPPKISFWKIEKEFK